MSEGGVMAVLANDNGAPRRLRDLLAGSEPAVSPGAYLGAARTVREYEAAGVAALHIEDQVERAGPLTAARAPMELLDSLVP
jgi:hypothetical protein